MTLTGRVPNDLRRSFRQQTKRCRRVCRIRLCRRHRARRVLGPRAPQPGFFKRPAVWIVPAAGRFHGPSPRVARNALAGIGPGHVGEFAFEGRGEREAVEPFDFGRAGGALRGTGSVRPRRMEYSAPAPMMDGPNPFNTLETLEQSVRGRPVINGG